MSDLRFAVRAVGMSGAQMRRISDRRPPLVRIALFVLALVLYSLVE